MHPGSTLHPMLESDDALSAEAKSRSYRSPRRAEQAEQTRAAVLETATRMFAEKGWAATGMRDIAREAGVATETVYSHFSSKTGLFQQVIDIAVVGDDASVAMAERPEFAATGQGSRSRRIAQAARVTAEVHRRTGRFAKVLREAAPSDDSIAEMLRSTRERQRLDIAAGAELLLGRPPTSLELDGLWATLSPEMYLLLVEDSGWAVEQYQSWVAQTLESQVSET